jgi:hypothetical protein
VVVNSGTEAIELLAYPVDGLTGATSGVVYANRGQTRRGASRWVHLSSSHLTIAAGATTEVAVTANMPRKAKPGQYLAGIAFETAHPTTSGGHFSITEIFRAVVGLEMIVPGRAKPQVKLSGVALSELPGTNYPALIVRLSNTGSNLCKPLLWLDHRWVSHQLDTVLGGSAIPYPFPWPVALKAGSYPTTVEAFGCGRKTTLKAVAVLGQTLTRTEASISPAIPAGRGGGGWGWIPYIAFALGGIAVGSMITLRRGDRGKGLR